MKKYTNKSVPIEQVLLRLAKDEYPDYEWFPGDKNTVWQGHNHAQSFTLSDSDIMPIWRREADDYLAYLLDIEKEVADKKNELIPLHRKFIVLECIFEISKSLEAIARSICDMRHPCGVEEAGIYEGTVY